MHPVGWSGIASYKRVARGQRSGRQTHSTGMLRATPNSFIWQLVGGCTVVTKSVSQRIVCGLSVGKIRLGVNGMFRIGALALVMKLRGVLRAWSWKTIRAIWRGERLVMSCRAIIMSLGPCMASVPTRSIITRCRGRGSRRRGRGRLPCSKRRVDRDFLRGRWARGSGS